MIATDTPTPVIDAIARRFGGVAAARVVRAVVALRWLARWGLIVLAAEVAICGVIGLATIAVRGGIGPQDPAPVAQAVQATPPADAPLCGSDAECASVDAYRALAHGVRVALDPAEPMVTPYVTVTPEGGVRLDCRERAMVESPRGTACQG